MSQRRKLIILVLLVLTVILAGLGILISNNIQVRDTSAGTSSDFSNCDTNTGICTVPDDTICSNVNVYVHHCDDIKANGIDCVNIKPENFKDAFVSGDSIDITDYVTESCGTVQMYLESAASAATSVGACGSIKQTFTTACSSVEPPLSAPVSAPVNPTEPEEPQNEEPEPTEPEEPQQEDPDPDEEPEITNSVSVISQSASTCSAAGAATINYTITVTNIGNQAAEINSVTENLAADLATNSIIPTSISTGGLASGNQIVWNGPISIDVEESKTFTYSIVIPQAKLETFAAGVSSQSAVSYDNANQNGNSASFTLKSMFSCTIPTTGLPNTGILDDLRFFIIGIMFISLGYFVYKRDLGLNYSLNFLNGMAAFRQSTKKKISKSVLNAAPFEEGIEERIKEKIKRRAR